MAPKKQSNDKRKNEDDGKNQSDQSDKRTKSNSDGKVPPPDTGWEGPLPNQKGGSEEGYLFKPPYAWKSEKFKTKYHSACWCGKVEFEYHGDPIDAKHCHCTQCQRLHGACFQWAALYFKTSVRLKPSCDPMYLKFFSTQERHSDHSAPCKVSCRNCGSHLLDEGRTMVMAYPPSFGFKDQQIPDAFAPSCHIFYKNRVINVDDGVPKWSGHKDKSELMPHDADGGHKLGLGNEHKYKDRHNLEKKK